MLYLKLNYLHILLVFLSLDLSWLLHSTEVIRTYYAKQTTDETDTKTRLKKYNR